MGKRRIEFAPGEVFMVADKMILVDEYESILGDTYMIGGEEHQIAYLFTFQGRVNKSTEMASVTIAMSPQDAFQLGGDILDGIELLLAEQKRLEEEGED